MNCPKCCVESVKRGFRQTNLGKKQLYLCGTHGKFTPDCPKMRFRQSNVMHAVRLYKRGLSSSRVQKILEGEDVRVSRWTIIKWHKKFAEGKA